MHRNSAALCVTVAILFASGCSSADFETAGDAGSGADSTPTDTTTDATIEAGCIQPPTATGDEPDFCAAVAYVYSRCGNCESCRQANANNCIQFGDGISDAYKRAFVACKETLTCGDFAAWGSDPCILAQLDSPSTTWSAKQLAAKDAYCTKCPSNAYECAHYFDFSSADAGSDAGTNGIGGFVGFGNDETAQNVLDKCSDGTALDCNPVAYALCTAGQFCSPMPHDACGSNFCNK